MNSRTFSRRLHRLALTTSLTLATIAFGAIAAQAGTTPAVLDDFSDVKRNGTDRFLVTDKDLGSQSHATQKCEGGVLAVAGDLVPGRGVPAFISLPLLLSSDAKPHDLSNYEGVRIRVKVAKGSLSVQVASSEIQNFDYHTSAPLAGKRGEFQEIRLAFKDMKRAWSEQTPLNPKVITSVNLVAFGLAKDAFAYEVDEIGFY
jgi:hypothetical protein